MTTTLCSHSKSMKNNQIKNLMLLTVNFSTRQNQSKAYKADEEISSKLGVYFVNPVY